MAKIISPVGIRKHLDKLDKSITDLKKGKGSILAIAGEEGYGKTYLLNVFAEEAKKQHSDLKIVLEHIGWPIGSFNIGNIQPLLPFSKILEKILTGDTFDKQSALSKFVKNAGITFLASVPFIDTVFYAVKELGRDWRQYQTDKSSEKRRKNASNTSKDFYDAYCAIAQKKPLMIMIDDFHWADAQSVELLDLFAEDISEIPAIFVITYRKSIVENQGSPLIGFINNKIDKISGIHGIKLGEFSKNSISQISSQYIENYTPNLTFENWLYDNSFGVPGVVNEYLKYFSGNSPFRNDGTLVENFAQSDYLPSSVHSAFSKTLEILSETDKNILSVCSTEGRECTAVVISSLLNTDVLSAIKTLRSIQNNSGIIRSIGAHTRYGVKTTIYEFTQAFYKKYFENLLEYEEYVSLHGQIAAFLKNKYNEADSESLKQDIAPYIAAHSIEAGDKEAAKSMLLVTARAAQKFGNPDILQEVYNKFNELGVLDDEDESNPDVLAFKEILKNANVVLDGSGKTANSEGNGASEGTPGSASSENFMTARKILVEYYHNLRFNEAVDYALDYLNKNVSDLRASEQAQIIAIIIKSYIEAGQLELAENYATQALSLLEIHNDLIAECFIMNSIAILRYRQGRKEEMFHYLQKAAQKAISLSPELRLLTLSNIALLLEKDDPLKSRRYFESVRKLTSALHFEEFAEQVLR